MAVCTSARPRGERNRLLFQMFLRLRERHPTSILLDHEEGTDQPHGESTWFLRSCAASCDYKRMPLVSFNFLYTTGRSTSRVLVNPARLLSRRRKPCTNRNQASHCCLLCDRCVKLKKSRIKNISHRLYHMLNLFRCSFHLCPTFMTTSSGSICLYLVSRERGLQKLHSIVAPTMLPRRDLLRLAMCAEWRNMFLDEDKKGEKRKGGTSAALRVSSKARSRQTPGSASGDPMMVMDSPSTADGATGFERARGNQSVDLLTHRLERIELLSDHRDELLLQCAQSRRLLEGFLCRAWLVEGDVASFQPFAAAKTQGKAYSEAAKGQKGHQMGQPFMSVFAAFVNGLVTENPGGTGLAEVEVEWLNQFRKQLTSASDVGWFLEMQNIRETHPKGRPELW